MPPAPSKDECVCIGTGSGELPASSGGGSSGGGSGGGGDSEGGGVSGGGVSGSSGGGGSGGSSGSGRSGGGGLCGNELERNGGHPYCRLPLGHKGEHVVGASVSPPWCHLIQLLATKSSLENNGIGTRL